MKMKILITVGESDIMFNLIRIECKERTFSFANATIQKSMEEVYRYYSDADIISIDCIRTKPLLNK